MIAIIGGTSLLESTRFGHRKPTVVPTEFGDAQIHLFDQYLFLQRHGHDRNTPPHRINYHANIAAIREIGVDTIIAVNSTGSLRIGIPPGSLVIPHDYFNLVDIPTYFDDELRFTVPGISEELRRTVISTAARHRIAVFEKGVYYHTRGPILETRTEISFIKQFADIVGMTMAKEAILARELDLKYASICMVDNYANGIVDEPLTVEEIEKTRSENLDRLESFLAHLLDDLRCT